jgi:Type II secretion system (T2SS), protein M
MTGRDRMVLIAVVIIAVLGGAWMLVVSPERDQASKLTTQVAEAKTQLATAEGALAHAHAAQSQYATAYASIVSLGKAVPASQELPSLIYQLTLASNQKKVDFASIVSGAGGSGGSSSATAAPTAAAATGFSQMPFTFVFDGSFFDLEHLFQQLNRFTLRGASGGLQVSGRLLTVQSVKLVPVETGPQQVGVSSGPKLLTGAITATAYVLPAAQGLTGGATPTSPAGATTPATSTGGAASAPSAPAIARVTP